MVIAMEARDMVDVDLSADLEEYRIDPCVMVFSDIPTAYKAAKNGRGLYGGVVIRDRNMANASDPGKIYRHLSEKLQKLGSKPYMMALVGGEPEIIGEKVEIYNSMVDAFMLNLCKDPDKAEEAFEYAMGTTDSPMIIRPNIHMFEKDMGRFLDFVYKLTEAGSIGVCVKSSIEGPDGIRKDLVYELREYLRQLPIIAECGMRNADDVTNQIGSGANFVLFNESLTSKSYKAKRAHIQNVLNSLRNNLKCESITEVMCSSMEQE